MVEHKQKILSRITALFEQMKAQNALPFEACVMDFACLPDKTLVIEVNPYVRVFTPPHPFMVLPLLSASPQLDSTGAGLFDWRRDKAVLEQGPLEFRVLERHPEHNYEGFVGEEWMTLLAEVPHAAHIRRGI